MKGGEGRGEEALFINFPSLRLSPRSFLAGRERQNAANAFRAEHNGSHTPAPKRQTVSSCSRFVAQTCTLRPREMAFDREAVKQRAAELAPKGVFIGTSSWKYEGWFGQLYT